MRASRLLPVILALSVALPLGALADPGPSAAEATMPLEEILRLYRETEKAKQKPEQAPPPVRATIHRMEGTGRLLDVAIDLTVRFEVVVLEGGDWVSVPLLRYDDTSHLSELPQVKHGFFSVSGGYLHFITRHGGSYEFEISLLKQAERDERHRSVRLEYEQATLAVCSVSFDKGLFRLRNQGAIERSEGVTLFPEDGAFLIEWERRKEVVETKKKDLPTPSIESIVPVAHASTVSTLEGRQVIRARYQLRFAGKKSIDVRLPDGLAVERAYLNGVSAPLDVEGDTLSVQVTPVREGDQSAILELVLVRATGGYLLSGSLEVELPRVSWPVHQMFLDVHLPQVFNYTWSGGSLSPVESSPSVRYTYDLPLPGKRLSFHQHLISASWPNVTLGYAVDLEGHYYRAR